MATRELPEQIVSRYRALACERLERIEAHWCALVRGNSPSDPEHEAELHREVHTLKGDSKVVGFSDVNLLCQKLEDVLFCARQYQYRVSDELDMVATMAVQFMGMLVRKKAGTSLGGIDLAGFLRELEGVLRNARNTQDSHAPGELTPVPKRIAREGNDRVCLETRQRLADAATSVFLESLAAPASAADRLHAVWRSLSRELATLEAMPLAEALERHGPAAEKLATELGKRVQVHFELNGLRAPPEVVSALDTAVLHAVRNAIDHGIETPEGRARAGKDEVARIVIRAIVRGHALMLEVLDDGGGIDLEQVRKRAVERGILAENQTRPATASELLALLSFPGFSTRTEVTETSGRGIGMDAVRGAVVKVGGTMELRTRLGAGTTLSLKVPQSSQQLDVHVFSVPNSRGVLAVASDWVASSERLDPLLPAAEPLFALQLAPPCEGDAPVDAGTLVLRRQGVEVRLLARGAPRQARADRLCPNCPTQPTEIVAAGGVEAVLLHDTFLISLARQPRP